jgi:hypothetical protein
MGVHPARARERHQTRNALDAFGYATISLRAADGCLMWQTPLKRELLERYFGTHAPQTPQAVLVWIRQCVALLDRPGELPKLTLESGTTRLIFRLHQQIGDSDAGGDWLIFMREVSDKAAFRGVNLAFRPCLYLL